MLQVPVGIRKSALVHIPVNTLIGLKPLANASFDIIQSSSPVDWSAVYPQLDLHSAISYLPNQFDRGVNPAVICSLTTVRDITLLLLVDDSFSNATIDGPKKAEIAKEMVLEHVSIDVHQPLLQELGKHNIMLCLPDADGFEIALPHSMFNETFFAMEPLFSFTFGPWGNIKKVSDLSIPKYVLDDIDALAEHLCQQNNGKEYKAIELMEAVAKVLST